MTKLKAVITVTLFLFFMTGLWLIDLGSSAMAIERVIDVKLIAVSLMTEVSPYNVYHTGLILCGVTFYLMSILYIFTWKFVGEREDFK